MLAQDRTAQLSPRTVLVALAAIAMVVLAVAAAIAIRWATTSTVATSPGTTTVHTQVSSAGPGDGRCVLVQGHKGC